MFPYFDSSKFIDESVLDIIREYKSAFALNLSAPYRRDAGEPRRERRKIHEKNISAEKDSP